MRKFWLTMTVLLMNIFVCLTFVSQSVYVVLISGILALASFFSFQAQLKDL